MPLIQEVRFDQVLTNIAVAYAPEGFIANDVLPPVPVKLEDGVYWVYDKSKFFTPEARRAPRTRYREIDWSATRDSYHAEEYGLETRIDDRERNNSAAPLDLDETGTETLVDNMLINREIRVASTVLSATNVTQNTTLVGADQWSDAAGGNPLGVAQTARDTIQGVSGMFPNSVVMGYKVYSKLLQNAKIKAELAEGEQTSMEVLKRLLQVENLYVGTVLKATSKKGQTVVLGDVWGKHALFFHKQARPALRRPAFGYQMVVSDLRTFRWRDTPVNCDVIRVTEIRAEKLVAPSLGYLVLNAVA